MKFGEILLSSSFPSMAMPRLPPFPSMAKVVPLESCIDFTKSLKKTFSVELALVGAS